MIPKDEYRSTDAARHIGQRTEQRIRRFFGALKADAFTIGDRQHPRAQSLISAAAEAVEYIDADELEAHAARVNAYRPKE